MKAVHGTQSRPRLKLEPLEPRVLLNATLFAGEFTYFDISAQGASDNVPDPGDLFVGLGDGTSALVSIELVEGNAGNSAPISLRIHGSDGDDTIEIFFNRDPGEVVNYSGGTYDLEVHHEAVTWDFAGAFLGGDDSGLSAGGGYVAAGAGLAAAAVDVAGGLAGDVPNFTLNTTTWGTLTEVSGAIVSHGAGNVGDFATNADAVGLTIDANGAGALAGTVGDVAAASWDGGGVWADQIGDVTLAGGSFAAGTFESTGSVGNVAVAGGIGGDITSGANMGFVSALGAVTGDVTSGGTLGNVLTVGGALSGIISSVGNMGSVTLGGGIALLAGVASGGSMGAVSVAGAIQGQVASVGAMGTVAFDSLAAGASVTSLAAMGHVDSGGDVDGTVSSVGNIGDVTVLGAVGAAARIESGGSMGAVDVAGAVLGDVVSASHMGTVDVGTGGAGGVAGSVVSGGRMLAVNVAGDVTGPISALGPMGAVAIAGSIGAAGSVEVTSAALLTSLLVEGDVDGLVSSGGGTGDVEIQGDVGLGGAVISTTSIGAVDIWGSLLGEVTTGVNLMSLTIGGDLGDGALAHADANMGQVDIDGDLLGELSADATMGAVNVAGLVGEDGLITGPTVGHVAVDGDFDGDLLANVVGTITVGYSDPGGESDLNGTVLITGSISQQVLVWGDLSGEITADGGNIANVDIMGSVLYVDAATYGQIRAEWAQGGGGFVGNVYVGGAFAGTVSALGGDIARVAIDGDADAATATITAERLVGAGGSIGQVVINGGGLGGLVEALGGDITTFSANGTVAADAVVRAERYMDFGGSITSATITGDLDGLLEADGGGIGTATIDGTVNGDIRATRSDTLPPVGGNIVTVTIGGDLTGATFEPINGYGGIFATGGDITYVSVGGSVGEDALIQATFQDGQGGSIGDVLVGEDLLGGVLTDWYNTETTATLDNLIVYGDLGQGGLPAQITAVDIGTLEVQGDVPGSTQVLPQVDSLTIYGTAADLWVWGSVQTAQIQDAGFLTFGGYHPHGSPNAIPEPDDEPEPRWDVGTLDVGSLWGSYYYGRAEGQIWIWGNVDTVNIQNTVGAAGVSGPLFVDGTVWSDVSIAGDAVSVQVGALAPGAQITVGGELRNTSGTVEADNSYIYVTGASDPAGGAFRDGGGLDSSNTVRVTGSNEFRIFSLDSLTDANIEYANDALTNVDWSAVRRDFFGTTGATPDDLVRMYEVQPLPNPGSGLHGPDGMHYHDGGWVGWAHYSDGIYGTYYYRGFRVDPSDPGSQVYRGEYLTFKDSYGGGYGIRNELPEVSFQILQGRMSEIGVQSAPLGADWANAAGIESSTALLEDIVVEGNLSFVYIHGDEDYRGDVQSVEVIANAGGEGSLTGARLMLFDEDYTGDYAIYDLNTVRNDPQGDPEPFKDGQRHVTLVTPQSDVPITNESEGVALWINIVGIYARNGSVGDVVVEGDVAGDVVAEFGGIDLVDVGAGRPDPFETYVAITQPTVLGHSPGGLVEAGQDILRFHFDQPMDAASFDLGADVVSFTGPLGPVAATGFEWLDADTLEVQFAPQVAVGAYDFVLGPDIANAAGTFASLSGNYAATFDIGAIADAWTFMIYMDGDNNLEANGIEDFLEMASAPPSADVNVVVLYDRIDGYDSTYGDWVDARQGLVASGATPSAAWGTSIGEVNMGDPDTLADFVNWATATYPAQNYGLVLWDHGSGWPGACVDETSNADTLEPREISLALGAIEQHIDLVGFDACMMATIEMAYEFVDHADVFVASQETEPLDGWPYELIIADLVANPGWTAEELGADIVAQYEVSYEGEQTQSALALAELYGPAGLTDSVSILAETILTDATQDDYDALGVHRDNSAVLACDPGYVDLGNFLDAVSGDATLTASIQAAAADALLAFDATIIAAYGGEPSPDASGLTIYFPEQDLQVSPDYRDWSLHFAADTQWDEFLLEEGPDGIDAWAWTTAPLGLYSTLYAKGALGDIREVVANAAWAYLNVDPADYLGGGAHIVAEGNIGTSDPTQDWAIWIGQGDATNGAGYVYAIEGGSAGTRTRIHAEVNDLWNIHITGDFRAEDRIELPYDNDLYFQVDDTLSWNEAAGFNVEIATERDGVGEGLGGADRADWSFPAPVPARGITTSDVAVARRFLVPPSGYNLYFLNEGDIDAAPGVQTFDADPVGPGEDETRVEFVQYIAVGGYATVDQYVYQGQIDRIEFVENESPNPPPPAENAAVYVSTKVYVELGQPGFDYYGRIIGTATDLLAVVAEYDLREARATTDHNIIGMPFGFTDTEPAFLSLDPEDAVDWDDDGDATDPTAVLNLRGFVHEVYTAENGSELRGDIVTQTEDIEIVDVTKDSGSNIDIVSAADILDVNIKDDNGLVSLFAAGDLHNIQTTGSIIEIHGGSVNADTLISAGGTIGTVEIMDSAWDEGDRLVSGRLSGGSDVFMTVDGGFGDGSVALEGPQLADGAQAQRLLQNEARVGTARYYYVSADYALIDPSTANPPYAELLLSNAGTADDEVQVAFGAADGALNSITITERDPADFTPPGGVARTLDLATDDRLSVVVVNSAPEAPAEPLQIGLLTVGGPNVYLAAASTATFDYDGDTVLDTTLTLAAPGEDPMNWSFALDDATIFPSDEDGYNSLWYQVEGGTDYEVPLAISLPELPGTPTFGLAIAAQFDEYEGEEGHLATLAITGQPGLDAPEVELLGSDFSATLILSDLVLLGIESVDLTLAGIEGGGLGGLDITGDLDGQVTIEDDRFIGPVTITGTLGADLVAGEFRGDVEVGALADGAVIEATGGTLTSGDLLNVIVHNDLQDGRIVAANDIAGVTVDNSLILPAIDVAGTPTHDDPRIQAGGSIGDVAIGGDLYIPFILGTTGPILLAETGGVGAITIGGNADAVFFATTEPAIQAATDFGALTIQGATAVLKVEGAGDMDSLAASGTLVEVELLGLDVPGGITAGAIQSLLVEGRVGDDVVAGSIGTLEIDGLDNESVIQATATDITELILHSDLLRTNGHIVAARNVGTVTVEGSLTGDPVTLGDRATPVIEATGGDIGVVTVGSAAADETVNGRFLANGGNGTFAGFDLDAIETLGALRIEGNLGTAGIDAPAGVALGGLSITGNTAGPIGAADMPLPVVIEGTIGADVASEAAIALLTTAGLTAAGSIAAATDIGALVLTGNFAAGTISAGGSIADGDAVDILGSMTGGTLRADGAVGIGGLSITGGLSGGTVRATAGPIGDVEIGGDVTGGRVVSETATLGALSIDGSLAVPYDLADPLDVPVFESAGETGAVAIEGDATGWLQAGGDGFAAGVYVGGDILDLYLDGDVHAASPAVTALGAIAKLTITGSLFGDVAAGATVQQLIVQGDLESDPAGGTVTIDAPVGFLYVGGTLPLGLSVGGPSLYLASAADPAGTAIDIIEPVASDPYASSYELSGDTFFPVGEGYNNFFFWRDTAPTPGIVTFTGTFQTTARTERAALDITVAQGDDWIPDNITVSPVNPFPLLVLSFETNTDIGTLEVNGDAGTVIIDGGNGTADAILIHGHLDGLQADAVHTTFQIDDGVDDVQLASMGLVDGMVQLTWGGETYEVPAAQLDDPSANGIPFDAAFVAQMTLGGTVLDLGGTDIYADLTLTGVEQLLNEGGTFFGDITSTTDLDLITAQAFGTGGYTAGPDGDADFDNAAGTNAVQGTFDDVFLNAIAITGNLGTVVATDDLFAEVSVSGDLFELRTGNDLGGSVQVGGDLGEWLGTGESSPADPDTIELDGAHFTHDDAAGGAMAGGRIFGPITAGGSITIIKAGTDIGLPLDWLSDTYAALSRHLIQAGSNIDAVYAGNTLYARLDAGGTLSYAIAGADIRSASRRDVIAQSGSATNQTAGGDPLINAAAIGFIGAQGQVVGATTWRLASGSFYSWTDEEGNDHDLSVKGATAAVFEAYSNIVRVDINDSGASVYSSGDLGIVSNRGNIAVVTGGLRQTRIEYDIDAQQQTTVVTNNWLTASIGSRSLYGLANDPVYTTGVSAGVLAVESLAGHVSKVVATGPVGSVVAHAGDVGRVDVVDASLGLTIAGEEFSLANGAGAASVSAGRNVKSVRVLRSLGLTTAAEAMGQQYGGGADAWLLASVQAGRDVQKVKVEHFAASVDVLGGRHVKDVQVIVGTGQLDTGLYCNFDRGRIVAQTGNVSKVFIGAARGKQVVTFSDSLIDIDAPAGQVLSVTVTGDILSDVGSAQTTRIRKLVSLSGSIGRRDLTVPADPGQTPLIPQITADRIDAVSALGSIFGVFTADRVGTIVAQTGTIGVLDLADTTAINVADSVARIESANGIGTAITTGGEVKKLVISSGGLTADLNVGGELRSFEAHATPGGDAVAADVTVGNGARTIKLYDGPLAGDLTVLAGDLKTLFVRNPGGVAIAGNVTVANGGIKTLEALGDLTGTVTSNDGLGRLEVGSELSGDVAVSGDAGTFEIRGTLSGTLTTTPNLATGEAGDVKAVKLIDGRIDRPGGVPVNIAGDLNLLSVTGYRGPELTIVEGDLVVGGHLKTARFSGGDVDGALTAASIGKAYFNGPAGLTQPVTTTAGDLDLLQVSGGPVATDVLVFGDLAKMVAQQGVAATANIDVGGDFGRLDVTTHMSGVLTVAGSMGRLRVTRGDMDDADILVADLLSTVDVSGNFTNTMLFSGRLGKIDVDGLISEDASDGDTDEINALVGTYTIADATWRGTIALGSDHWFDGLRASVG